VIGSPEAEGDGFSERYTRKPFVPISVAVSQVSRIVLALWGSALKYRRPTDARLGRNDNSRINAINATAANGRLRYINYLSVPY
jgi:hypothetical protein